MVGDASPHPVEAQEVQVLYSCGPWPDYSSCTTTGVALGPNTAAALLPTTTTLQSYEITLQSVALGPLL